ncbi:MAG TPA: BamA/TamA family outer membrane protein, partial [Longimicrobiales bacterium]
TLSALHYARGDVSASATRLLGRRLELAARLRLGALAAFGDTLPPQVRLFGGGPFGVRGAPQNLLGPKFLVADSAQLAALPCGAAAGSCAGVTLGPEQALVRATGGDLLLESGVEARLWVSGVVQLAAFLDYGYVRSGALATAPASLSSAEALLSPGAGIRFLTPVGPVRLDLAYDPTRTVNYPLLAQRADGTFLDLGQVVYDPYGKSGGSAFSRFRRRLQLQFSFGQPF